MKNSDNKRVELLDYIKQTDKLGVPRLQAFANFAQKHHLKRETVRNLYYHLVRENNLCKEFNIEHSKHFTKGELRVVMQQIVNEINKGSSVRSACLKASLGDAKTMLRLQNKYRSLCKSNMQYLLDLGLNADAVAKRKLSNVNASFNKNELTKIVNKYKNNKIDKSSLLLKNDSIQCKNAGILYNNGGKAENFGGIANKNSADNSKVLRMPNSNILTDADINNLFMGLVRMVKRNAIENAPLELKNECESINASLKDALVKLGASTRKLEIIKCENYELRKRLEDSERLLKNARCEVVELLNRIDSAGKIEELKLFLQDYKKKTNKSNGKARLK